MAKVILYNEKGDKNGEIDLKDNVFAVEPNLELVHQVFVAQRANQRQPWAHTKDRGEVRGGGRKPWRQKGTGRARHGSIRSPLWIGGGVTFGPTNVRNYQQKINKKMRKKAIKICLSDKVKNDKFVVIEKITTNGKTKELKEVLAKLPGFGRRTLVLTTGQDANLYLALRNLPKISVRRAQDVTVMDLMSFQYILSDKDSLKILETRLS